MENPPFRAAVNINSINPSVIASIGYRSTYFIIIDFQDF